MLYDAFAVYRFHVSREKHSRAVCLSELYARGWQMSSPVREKTVSVFLIAAFSQRNGLTETGRLHKIEYHMQQKGAENVEQAKNTILLVRGTAAEPAALSAFTAAQPDVQLQTISGLDEAGAALERLRPTLIVLQSDAPDAQALHRCAELAETAEAVFLLLVRQEAYGAAWRTLQKHGVCVMTWPMEQAVLTQTLRNLLLLKKSMQTMQAQTDQLRSQLQDLKRIQKAKGLLMRQLGMTEQDAHRWIEKAAMDRCVKKREIAETIIRMYEL